MPKLPINYDNACIYKIVCNDLNIKDCYVGSTTNFIKRKYTHKFSCNNKNSNVYNFINNNGGWSNWSMILVDNNLKVNNNLELRKKEREYIESLNATLNIYRPMITLEEKKQQNDILKKKHYENNKDKVIEYQKQYRELNKDKIKEYKKQYRELNKNKLKQYYKNNKDKFKQYNGQKVKCEICNCEVNKNSISRHKKSKKHLNNVNNN